MSVLKHHFKKILTAALCLLFIFSLTVPLFAAGGNEINFYGEKKFVCDKTFYNHLSFSPEGTIVFCGKSMVWYETKAYGGLDSNGYQVYSTSDLQIVLLKSNLESSTAEGCWGRKVDPYLSENVSYRWNAFFDGKVSSYRMISSDSDDLWYIDLPDEAVYDSSYLYSKSSPYYEYSTKLFSSMDFKKATSYPIVGCDPTGSLGWIVGYVIVSGARYYYLPIMEPGETVEGYTSSEGIMLTNSGMAAFKKFLQESEKTVPKIQVEKSLKEKLMTRRIIVTVLFWSVVVLFLVAPVLFLLIRSRKSLWRKIRSLFRRDADVPVEDTGFKPFQISLTKEELTQTSEDDDETETPQTLRYCPHCGAACNWTALRCSGCGADLTVHPSSPVRRYRGNSDAASEHGAYGEDVLIELDKVSRKEYVDGYAPRKLLKFTKGCIVDYYAIVCWYALLNLVVAVELTTLSQSAVLGWIFFSATFVLLGFAIRYHQQKDLASAIVVTVYSVTELFWFLLGLESTAVFYPLPVIILDCILMVLPVIASFLILACAIFLSVGYRSFRNGNIYQ